MHEIYRHSEKNKMGGDKFNIVCMFLRWWIKLWHCEEQIKIQQIYEQNISTYGEVFLNSVC